jgi:hypothetical protein
MTQKDYSEWDEVLSYTYKISDTIYTFYIEHDCIWYTTDRDEQKTQWFSINADRNHTFLENYVEPYKKEKIAPFCGPTQPWLTDPVCIKIRTMYARRKPSYV